MFDIPGLGVPELILLLVLALIIFGPGKLPDIGRSLGRAINEFKAASQEITREYREEPPPEVILPVPDAVPAEPETRSRKPEDDGAPGGTGGSGPR